jgi:hypothetical protein
LTLIERDQRFLEAASLSEDWLREMGRQTSPQGGLRLIDRGEIEIVLIGLYIAEYEQNGADRALYGTRLLENLSTRLSDGGMDSMASRSLLQYRQFYSIYPDIWQTPSAKTLDRLIPASPNTSLSCQRKRKCSGLLKNRFRKRNHERIPVLRVSSN